jgi:hypothetical protein
MAGFLGRTRKALSDVGKAWSDVDSSIHERGVAGTAVVDSVEETKVRVDRAWVHKYGLRVTVPGRATYQVEHFEVHREPGYAGVGQTIAVKVDPTNPEKLLIDWQAFRDQAQASLSAAIEAERDPNFARTHMRMLVDKGHFTKEQFDEAARYQGWEPYDAG